MSGRRGRTWWGIALVVVLLVAGVLSFYASAAPDGLESVAERLGFASTAREGSAPFPDYRAPGVAEERWSGGLAGVLGTLAVLGAMALLMLVLRPRRRRTPPDAS